MMLPNSTDLTGKQLFRKKNVLLPFQVFGNFHLLIQQRKAIGTQVTLEGLLGKCCLYVISKQDDCLSVRNTRRQNKK